MRLLRLLAYSLFFHAAALVLFPETGQWGFPYLGASLVVWSLVLATACSVMAPFFLISKWIGRLFEIVAMLLLSGSLLLLLPQEKGTSPLAQLVDGEYPTRETVDRGLSRLGLNRKIRRRAAREAGEKIREEAGR